jgi:hypothetical protein
VKTWLNGTFHGVSAKHLPRYAREWNYRFNRRRRITDLTDFLLRRATRPTITYRQLVDGAQINGTLPALTGEVYIDRSKSIADFASPKRGSAPIRAALV